MGRASLIASASWLSLGAAILVAAIALFCQWGLNAESLGAHDAGVAIFFAFVGAAMLIGSTYAAPVLGVLGVLLFAFQRPAAVRFLAAGAVCALPIAVLTWLERT
jgi:hypothetical protein